MLLSRPARADLRPYIQTLWAYDDTRGRPGDRPARERVLPTGTAHIAMRLTEHPVRLFEHANDPTGHRVGHSVVGGPRDHAYIREVSQSARSVGAQLRPGAVEMLLGVPARELGGRHTSLEDVWGNEANRARERIGDAGNPEHQLQTFESILAARLPGLRALHPAVAHALRRFEVTSEVRLVVKESGYSHRRFIDLFRHAVGLTPKAYCRVLRFQQALENLVSEPQASSARLALELGYSDQPHFNREFRTFAGISPGMFRKLSPQRLHHVPIPTR